MERSIVAVGETHQGGNSSTGTVSKSFGSLIKIDSISIDLGIAMEKNEARKCQHFSIRGYVAEMRQKDKKMCSPFALDSNHSKLEEQLPPLYVAKFRWWRCQNCLQEIGTASSSEEIGSVSKCCKSGLISSNLMVCDGTDGAVSHMVSDGEAATLLSDLQQAPTLENCEGRKADANLNCGDENYLSSCIYKKQKSSEGEHKAITGHANGLDNDANQEMGNLTNDLTKFHLFLIEESHTDSTVARIHNSASGFQTVGIKSKGSGLVDICELNCGIRDAAEIVPTIENPKCKGNSSSEICLTEKVNFSDEEQRNVPMACETFNECCKIDEAISAVKVQKIRLPSLEPEECDNASSESDEILAGDHSSGLTRQKTRKVRLLAELFSEKGNVENDHKKTEMVGNGLRGPRRKRKIPQEHDRKPSEMSCPNNAAKNVAFKGDAETTSTIIVISDSESEVDVSAGVGLQTGVKSQWSTHVIDRNATPGDKKNKQIQVGDGYCPLESWREVMPKINHIKIGGVGKCGATADTSFPKLTHDLFRGSGMEPFFENFMSLQQTGKESSSSKKRYRMPPFEDGEASLMSKSKCIFGEVPIQKNDVKLSPIRYEIVRPPLKNDECGKLGLDLALNSYMAAARDKKSYSAQVEDKIDPLLPKQKGIPGKDLKRKDVGESSGSHRSATNSFLGEGLLCDFNARIARRTAMLRQWQNRFPQLEDRSYSLHQKLDFSSLGNSTNTTEVQGGSETIRIRSDQRAEKVFEKGTSDDIPMEIVELMAKNQYERGLSETGRNYCPSGRFHNNMNAEVMGFPKIHGNGWMRSLQKEYPGIIKTPSTNPINGETVVPANQNLVNSYVNRRCSNVGKPEDNHAFTKFGASSQSQQKVSSEVQISASSNCQQKVSSEVQISASGTLRNTGVQISASGTLRNTGTQYHDPEGYKACHSGTRHKEAAEKCMTPNQMPVQNIEMHSQCPKPQKKKILNLFDLNTPVPENQDETFDFQPSERTSEEHPSVSKQRGIELNPKKIGSLDPYPNETITALQLLGLMDARMSRASNLDSKKALDKTFSPCDNHPNFSMDGKWNFLEKPLFPCDNHSKKFSGLGPEVFKASEVSKHPSSACYGKKSISEKSCQCSPAVSAAESFVSLLQNGGNFKSVASSSGNAFVKSQDQERAKRSNPPTQNSGCISQNSVLQDKQKGILGASHPVIFPLKSLTVEDSTKCETVRPLTSIAETNICCVNRNPADFSIPKAGNVYLITGEDLSAGKRIPSRGKSDMANVDGRKRQRIKKIT